MEVNPVYLRTEDHVRGHIVVCFLALVLEVALIRRLRKNVNPGPLFNTGVSLTPDQGQEAEISYRDTLNDLDQVRAVEIKSNRKSWLVRTELAGQAGVAFQAVGLRPPPLVQPLTRDILP